MIDDWYSTIELQLTIEQFRHLPRNAAYKYEFMKGRAWLTPRPKRQHAVLALKTFVRPIADIVAHDKVVVRPLQEADWPILPQLFAHAFHRVQPYESLTDEDRLAAADECLGETREGAEGPLVGAACLVAARSGDDAPVGAAVITLPPDYAIENAEGLPHLTWIFVAPLYARRGVGCALLDAAVKALLPLGYAALASTFLLGNESSMLWHWKAGFRLLESGWTMRPQRGSSR